jgi:hypothetical protein
MLCYLCRSPIGPGQYHYNDHGVQVCKPCFLEAKRCFICRFPGKQMADIPGLGPECEFCRGQLVQEGSDLEQIITPFFRYVAQFGHKTAPHPTFVWTPRTELRAMQEAPKREEPFIDDFLHYSYPVYYRAGLFHLLPRLTKPSFVVYTIIQLVAADLATRHGLPDLSGHTPFHLLARGWAHWIGLEAATRLDYDLERRQLRKWPELGAKGDFERFEKMAHFKKPAELAAYLNANLLVLARKHLGEPASQGAAKASVDNPVKQGVR